MKMASSEFQLLIQVLSKTAGGKFMSWTQTKPQKSVPLDRIPRTETMGVVRPVHSSDYIASLQLSSVSSKWPIQDLGGCS